MNRETQYQPRRVPSGPQTPDKRGVAKIPVVADSVSAPVRAQLTISWPVAGGLGLLFAAFLWTYWPTFLHLAHAWNVEPDYSHGYFVIPLALGFLWLRRDRMPQPQGPGWGGLALIGSAFALHIVGSLYYLDSFHGWSIPLWCAGAAWLYGGKRFCLWTLPAVAFLVFMVPLPARVEGALSRPLQRVSTEISCWMLQSLSLPALAEGNLIMIEEIPLEVARACSGLRIFVSIIALAYAYSVLVRRPWWMKALLYASVIPTAVIANAVRVTLIGVAYSYFSAPDARHHAHSLAGLFVIPLAAAMMGALIWYLGKLFVQERAMTGRELLTG